ncbi:MAG TPA: tetratricopeptide repeat protein [Gemmatimonadales bacterium]|nr:tetratricopeptide repeat protein [Gemmatimonadales bacterium]
MDPTPDPNTAELEARGTRGLSTGERRLLRRRLSPRWAFFSFAVFGLLGVTLWLRYTAPTPAPAATTPEPRPTSVAVLPLVNASPDSANEYFSDGMTEELTAALGRVPGLRVAAPSSAFALKGRGEDPRDVGRRLNVGTVLEGSVRQDNDRLRVNVHLVSVSEGFDLWSETYERPVGDVWAVQQEIARSVVAALRAPGARPGPPAPLPTSSLDAYTAYLRARYAMSRPGAPDPSHAVGLFQEAIRLDSAFAPGWAGLAAAQVQRAVVEGARPADAMPAALEAAGRALALDSGLAVAHSTIGQVRFLYDRDWNAADSAFQRALVINPNRPEVHHWYAHLLAALGRTDEAFVHGRRALDLSPLDPELVAHFGWHFLYAKRYADARESLDRASAVDSSLAGTRYLLGLLAEVQGDYELAESHFRGALDRAPDDLEALASVGRTHALAGRPEDARAVLARLDSLSAERYVSPYLLAGIAEALDDKRRAFAWLEEAVADHAGQLVYLNLDPRLDRLRGDRRFARIRRSVGLP